MHLEALKIKLQAQSSVKVRNSPQIHRPKDAAPWRVLWLASQLDGLVQMATVHNALLAQGILVYFMETRSASSDACRRFDLIILHVTDEPHGEIEKAIRQIRATCYAPILILADNRAKGWLLTALPAGADAVLSTGNPIEVILARCAALLWRWSNRPGFGSD